MLEAGLVPHHIVVLNASHTALLGRIEARAREAVARGEAPRSDDNVETVRQRLVEYEKNKDATLAALRRYMRIGEVNGSGTQESVASAISTSLAD